MIFQTHYRYFEIVARVTGACKGLITERLSPRKLSLQPNPLKARDPCANVRFRVKTGHRKSDKLRLLLTQSGHYDSRVCWIDYHHLGNIAQPCDFGLTREQFVL